MMMPFAQTILLGLAIITIVFRGLENGRNMTIPIVSKCFWGQKNQSSLRGQEAR